MSNSVEYEIYMNDRRDALEAFATLKKKKYTHAEVMYIIDKNNNSVEYEIYMNERRDDEEALALKKYTHAEIMNIKEDLSIIKTGLKKYTHAEVMDLIDEKTKSQKLAYESEIQEIAYAVKIWPSELQQLQWSPGGLKGAIIERIKRDEKTKSQKLAYESEIKILKSKLDNIYDDISTLLDGGFAVEWDRQHLHSIQSTTLY